HFRSVFRGNISVTDTVTNPKVCSPSGKKGKIKLYEPNDAAIVEETRSFDKWPGVIKFHCQFEVKDARGDNDHAVFAVIQNLQFRETEEGCLDYVEFQSDDEHKSGKLCGKMGPSIPRLMKGGVEEIAPYAFVSSDEIEVTIHVATKRLLPGESLDLKIAFTSARHCYRGRDSLPSYLINCGNSKHCINSIYANDTIFNCPFSGCSDEGGCPIAVPTYHRPSVGTSVTVGAITTVLAAFLLFFACIWVLRHYRKLCWAGDYNSQREVRMTPVSPVQSGPDSMEAGTARQEHLHGAVPSAPPLDSPVSTILPDKDMPPPYESLFPATSR
ncbi:Uncharacterized protein GBIM_18956, partial [Gryllus bimaculatus]